MADRYLNNHQINNSWLRNRVLSKIPKKKPTNKKEKKKKEETVEKDYNCDDDNDVPYDVSFGCGLPNDESEWLDLSVLD